MPRSVRNFWLDASIEDDSGNVRNVATGPQGKNGRISLDLLVRCGGSPLHALRIQGWVRGDGTLELRVEDREGEVCVFERTYTR